MKKLQNNFTTPEQSKRLLELGVPADSADCYWQLRSDSLAENWGYRCYIGTSPAIKDNLFSFRNGYTIPCWSVGRLMEIYEIVGENAGQCVTTTKGTSRIENLVKLYEENATLLDFSKLEE